MDQHEYHVALEIAEEAIRIDIENCEKKMEGFSQLARALVILSAFEYYLLCHEGRHGDELKKHAAHPLREWAKHLPEGHMAAKKAVELIPSFNKAVGLLKKYDDMAEKYSVFSNYLKTVSRSSRRYQSKIQASWIIAR
jgi:hypothetical protein